MKKKNFEEAIEQFNLDLKVLNIGYKNSYCTDERREIFKLCRKIKRSELPTSTDGKIPVDEASIRPFSIRSLKVFNNSAIVDYFDEKTFLYREEEILGKRLLQAGYKEGV